jgi:nitrite reductase/ring-hydroxylating ferredoxin subunit
MTAARPGERIEAAPYLPALDFSGLKMRVSTERYASASYQAREREQLWMRVWQIAGRADELPQAGDWKTHAVYDQSFILVRGKDGAIRGFVNACRHRGNALCQGTGRTSLFRCPYHNWSYGLDGRLAAVAKPDFDGPVEAFVGRPDELGLVQVPVEVFGGFIFLNPHPAAAPLADFLGEAGEILAAYRLEELTPVGINVRERVDCNWKVVMDAFGEGYHTQGLHPELVGVVDMTKERFASFGAHGVATVPFGAAGLAEGGVEAAVQAILDLPTANFPGLVEPLRRLAEQVAACRGPDGALALPPGATAASLLQQAVRGSFVERGLEVGGLTDSQMTDYQFWLLFPNVFLQVCAGECTTIIAEPDPAGDPNRCYWRVMTLQWLPPEARGARRTPLTEIAEGDHFPYFLALEQDFQQMPIQQAGLKNRGLDHLVLTRQEPRVAHFHTMLDRWVG